VIQVKLQELIIIFFLSFSGIMPKNPALLAFSVQKNLAELFYIPDEIPSGTVACLHGIRVFSLVWVLFGHRVHVQTDMANINALQITKVTK